MKRLLSGLLFSVSCLAISGQDLQEHAVTFGVGRTNQYDTYLSPMEYRGPVITALRETSRRLVKAPLSFQSLFEVHASRALNGAENADFLGGDVGYDAGWYYNWDDTLLPGLTLRAGGQLGGTLGFVYSTKNGNNPAQAHLGIRLAASVAADYSTRIRRLPIRLRYQADLPVLGGSFLPNYGQAYYEISQNGFDHNVVCTYPGNALSLRQMLTADVTIAQRVTLRLGYLSDLRQLKANNLRQHQYNRSFLIGWVKTFEVKNRKP